MALAVAAMAGLLAFYKYGNLVVELLVGPVVTASGGNLVWERLILPIGISFIVLQSVSYVVDVYWRTVQVERDFIGFAAYQAMFSQLIAGPIVRYSHVEHELHSRPFDVLHVSDGLRYFMVGLSMKVIVADTLAPLVNACYALPMPTLADAWLGTFAYSLQLFFDFAGYSVMGIGLGIAGIDQWRKRIGHDHLHGQAHHEVAQTIGYVQNIERPRMKLMFNV
jgi:alginate O-acetyltransferase complex protein AlgI